MECQSLLDNSVAVCVYWALVLVLLLMVFFELRNHNIRAMLGLKERMAGSGTGASVGGAKGSFINTQRLERLQGAQGLNERLQGAQGLNEHLQGAQGLNERLTGALGIAKGPEHLVFVEGAADPAQDLLMRVGAGLNPA